MLNIAQLPSGTVRIYHGAKLLLNSRMDIAAIRFKNLDTLIEELGSAAAVARMAGSTPAYISQIRTGVKTQAGKTRGIGTDFARALEKGCGKPHGWMDVIHDPALLGSAIEEENAAYSITGADRLGVHKDIEKLNDEEIALVKVYLQRLSDLRAAKGSNKRARVQAKS